MNFTNSIELIPNKLIELPKAKLRKSKIIFIEIYSTVESQEPISVASLNLDFFNEDKVKPNESLYFEKPIQYKQCRLEPARLDVLLNFSFCKVSMLGSEIKPSETIKLFFEPPIIV